MAVHLFPAVKDTEEHDANSGHRPDYACIASRNALLEEK
jgi:hypothetical protein